MEIERGSAVCVTPAPEFITVNSGRLEVRWLNEVSRCGTSGDHQRGCRHHGCKRDPTCSQPKALPEFRDVATKLASDSAKPSLAQNLDVTWEIGMDSISRNLSCLVLYRKCAQPWNLWNPETYSAELHPKMREKHADQHDERQLRKTQQS